MPRPSTTVACGAALAAALALAPVAAAQVLPPRADTLSSGWQVRVEPAAPAPPQPPPPDEGPDGTSPLPPIVSTAQTTGSGPETYVPTSVPSVFDTRALPDLYPGQVRRYRLRFTGPPTPRGFSWLLQFDEVRRAATVFLNGRRLGKNSDPYTPFALDARGLRPGRPNELVVIVDNRKNPNLAEGWWNWGGIVRAVHLMPVGPAYVNDLGYLSRVRCSGPATGCRATLQIVGSIVNRRGGGRRIAPSVSVRLRAPSGRIITRTFRLHRQRGRSHDLKLDVPIPAPQLWAPEHPQLYGLRLTVRDGRRVTQVDRRHVGLRSVTVKHGGLYLNNRRIRLRGASIHEDMQGDGAALTPADDATIVQELKDLGANVTRAHYLLNEDLLNRLDRAGIMVWDEAPIWQRDNGANLLRRPIDRARAVRTVERTVVAARSHPAVITHSVANELSFVPDAKTPTRLFLIRAAKRARALDPTLPISVDIKGRPGVPEQFTYAYFDMIGMNVYFGWYKAAGPASDLRLYLQEMRDIYPDQALVATEFGAEAPPAFADRGPDFKGSYAWQANWVDDQLNTLDSQPYLSGAIYWTLREFEIYPGWTGGGPSIQSPMKNTRHHKGLITYDGQRKPAWTVVHDHFARFPLYAPAAPAP